MHCHGFFKGLLFTVIDVTVACVGHFVRCFGMSLVHATCCVCERNCVYEAVLTSVCATCDCIIVKVRKTHPSVGFTIFISCLNIYSCTTLGSCWPHWTCLQCTSESLREGSFFIKSKLTAKIAHPHVIGGLPKPSSLPNLPMVVRGVFCQAAWHTQLCLEAPIGPFTLRA